MSDSPNSPLIAIDGGGTHCRFALQLGAQRLTAKREGANVYSAPEAAVDTIIDGLRTLAAEAGLTLDELKNTPTYAGLAGVFDAAQASEIAARVPLAHLRVEDDRPAAVVGALGARNGSLIACGTGSFLARQSNQDILLVGGHGFQVGDEASGAWLGKQALRHSLLVIDGICPNTPLAEKVFETLPDREAIVGYAQTASPADFGRFAPIVTETAAQGDALAVAIMQRGASYIQSALVALGHTAGDPLCLAGSAAPYFMDYLPEPIANGLTPSQGSPLDGALRLARRFAEELEVGLAE